MTRNLKALGLALVAVFAMSAMAASGASAQTSSFTADEYPAHIDGVDVTQNKLTAFEGTTSCTEASYDGTLNAASNTLTITPTFAGCEGSGGLVATVTKNGCDYEFNLDEHVDEHHWNGGVTVVCPTGQQIVIHYYSPLDVNHVQSLCTVDIPPQHLTGVTFTVETGADASEDDLRLEGTIEGIEATKTKGHPEVCPQHETTTTAKYDLDVTLQGTNELEEPNGLRISTD